MPLGLYISVPFCRSKCSYCNFASDVFSPQRFAAYVERVCADMARAAQTAEAVGGSFEARADTVYLGGGTPSVLAPAQLEQLFRAVRENFDVAPDAEITVECAPGTLGPEMVETLLGCGVNRVSLGVQSFVDAEAAAVGRLHSREIVLADLERLRAAGVTNINLDLLAGLPRQTPASWHESLQVAVATGAPHLSVYMLEVDEDSRLGRELMAGGTRYHAHFVPEADTIAGLYTMACETLEAAGVAQYEISNFARPGKESRHNRKYWTRQPYCGFGVDAHSMLPAEGMRGAAALGRENDAVRFATADSLDDFLAGKPVTVTPVGKRAALEEAFFLGLRLNHGVDLERISFLFGSAALAEFAATIRELAALNLLAVEGKNVRLTPTGRLLSNEVFERFLAAAEPRETTATVAPVR